MKSLPNDAHIFVGSFTHIFVGSFPLDEVRASRAAAMIVAPWISNMVMAKIDYDGNGFLSPDEIRITLKDEVGANITHVRGAAGRIRNEIDELMPTISGVGQLLGMSAGDRK